MQLEIWKAEKVKSIRKLDCDAAVKEFINDFVRQFIEVCTDYFHTEFEIKMKVKSVKRKLKVVQGSMDSFEYLAFWMEFGRVVEEWISELEWYEHYEAAGNIKKLFDAC